MFKGGFSTYCYLKTIVSFTMIFNVNKTNCIKFNITNYNTVDYIKLISRK